MNHKSDIRLINSHTEGICGYDNRRSVIDEIILVFLARLIVNSRVIPGHRHALFKQIFIQRVHILPGCAVNDSALVAVLFYVVRHKGVLVFSGNMLYAVIEIFSVKACDNDIRLLQLQNTFDVSLNLLRRRCGKCAYNRPLGKALNKVDYL